MNVLWWAIGALLFIPSAVCAEEVSGTRPLVSGAAALSKLLPNKARLLEEAVAIERFLDALDGEPPRFDLLRAGLARLVDAHVLDESVEARGDDTAAGGAGETMEADCVLVAIGRRPHTEGLNLAAIGLELNARGQIETDEAFVSLFARPTCRTRR